MGHARSEGDEGSLIFVNASLKPLKRPSQKIIVEKIVLEWPSEWY